MYEIFCHHSYFHQVYISTNSSLKESFSFFICSLWLSIFGAVGKGVWLDEFVSFFFFEIGGDLFGGVGGHSFLLFDIELEKSSVAWLWLSIFITESWNGISNSGGPVLKILSFFSFVGFLNCWLLTS